MSSSSSSPTSSSQSSTTSTPFFTNSPSATSGPQTNGNSGASSSLYLFTFLATLFLLLLISCGIILRSFVVRRRLQRNIADALAVGVILPATLGGHRSRREVGEKPKFYDTWVQPGGEKWESIMPISAQIRPSPASTPQTMDIDAASMIASTSTFPFLNRFTRWRRSPRTSNFPNQSSSESVDPSSSALRGADEEGDVQVSVLVAMPSPKSKPSSDGNEAPKAKVIPEMVVGIAHLSYRTNPSAEVSTSKLDGGE